MKAIEMESKSFIERNRDLQAEFNELVKEFKEGLWKYCLYITGSPWDGEDLFQDTMLKAYGGFYQRWHPTNTKSYLYRVATTTWIDQCRRKKMFVGELKDEDLPMEEFNDDLEMEEALKYLTNLFSPRQTALLLLKEVFAFTAEEVAGMVHTTPGAVYATVRRMKKQLNDQPPQTTVQKKAPSTSSNQVIEIYLNALNEGNVEGILALLSETAHNEANLGFQEFSKDEMRSGSLKYGLPGFRAEQHILWGKEVIVVFYDGGERPELHDIQYHEVENDKIVYHRSYYFRKEFILAAAEELGIKPQMDKAVVDW